MTGELTLETANGQSALMEIDQETVCDGGQRTHALGLRLDWDALARLRFELIQNLGSPVAKNLLLRFGHRSGRNAATSIQDHPGMPASDGMLAESILTEKLNAFGVTVHFNPGNRIPGQETMQEVKLVGTIVTSPEALSHLESCGEADESCCWITTGFMSGFLTVLLETPLLCMESECRAAGGNSCRIEIGSPSDWGELGKATWETLSDSHLIEPARCRQDHEDCSIGHMLNSLSDPKLRRELEGCMWEVEKLGRQLQHEVEQKQGELHKRNEFLANILRDSADAIITIGLDDRITSWNKGAESVYGYAEREVVGKSIEMLLSQENRDSGELLLIRRKLDQEGVVRNYRARRITKNGREIDVIVTRTPIRNEAEEIIGSSAVVKDVTQLRSIENQLSRAEHLATLGELAASLAHEIKNPLAGIKGAIEVIMDQCAGPKSNREVLLDVIQEVKRIDRTIRDLLGYARPKDPRKSQVLIRETIRRVGILFDRTIEQKKITLKVRVARDADIIYADENLLEQVLLNLVLNGLQALPERGTLLLSTRRTDAAGSIEINVQDDGPGIPPENLPRLFQPFFTTKKEGTGLGLATCKRIIQDQGGSLTVTSQPGQGAAFRIWLPAEAAVAGTAPDHHPLSGPRRDMEELNR